MTAETDYEKRINDLEKETAILWKRVREIERLMETMADTMKKLSLRTYDMHKQIQRAQKTNGKIIEIIQP